MPSLFGRPTLVQLVSHGAALCWLGGLGVMVLAQTAHAQPANDLCSGAVEVTAATMPFHVVVDASTASSDTVDTQFGPFPLSNGVWYTFTAPEPGRLSYAEALGAAGFTLTPDCASAVIPGHELDPQTGAPNYGFAAAGQSVKVLVSSGFDLPSGPYDLTFTFSPAVAPVNDTCATATDLTGLSLPYLATVDNLIAGDDAASCGTIHHGVWYTFTAPADGYLVCSETGAQAAAWAALVGSTCGTPTCLGDDSSPRYIPLLAGQTAKVLVGGASADSSSLLNLSIDFVSNDTCASAQSLNDVTLPYQASPDNYAAGDDAADCGPIYHGLWYTFVAPSAGTLRCSGAQAYAVSFGPCGSGTPVCQTVENSVAGQGIAVGLAAGQRVNVIAGSSDSALTAPNILDLSFDFVPLLPNDDCAHATDIGAQMLPYSVSLDNLAAGDDSTDCGAIYHGMWFTYTAQSAGTLTIAQNTFDRSDVLWAVGSGCSTPECVLAGPIYNDVLEVGFAAGETKTILVGNAFENPESISPIDVTFDFVPVVHDTCQTAIDVNAEGQIDEFGYTTFNAQIPYAGAGDDTASCGTIYHGLWLAYTAPAPTTLVAYASTAGNYAVTQWAVAPDCASGPACEDGDGVLTNRIHLHMTAGQAVRLLVGTIVGGSTTPGTLDVGMIALPDDCSDALPVTVPATVTGALYLATPTFGGVAGACYNSDQSDLWYAVHVTQAGSYTFSLNSTSGDQSVAVELFSGCGSASLACASRPADVSAPPATIQIALNPGTYIARVSSGDIFNATFQLDISGPPACPADFDGNGTVNVSDIFAFLRAWFAHSTTADIDGNATVNVSDIFSFLRHWFGHC